MQQFGHVPNEIDMYKEKPCSACKKECVPMHIFKHDGVWLCAGCLDKRLTKDWYKQK